MKKRYKFVLIPLGVLVMLLVVSALVVDWHGGRTLERQIDAAVANGGSRDYLRFARPDLSDNENAATLWITAAVSAWGEPDADWRGHPEDPLIEAINDPEAADPETLKAAVESRRDALDMAWAAAERSEVHWPIDYGDPLSWFDETYRGQARSVGRLLTADAHAALSAGDLERAQRDLLTILALSDDIAEPATLINILVSISLDTLVMGVIDDFDVGLKKQMPDLHEEFFTRHYRTKIAQGMQGEIPFGLTYFESDHPDMAYLSRWPTRLWTQYDMAYYVKTVSRMSDLAAQPFAEVETELALMDESVGLPYVLSGIMLPAGTAAIKTANMIETKRDLMLLASEIAATPADERLAVWGVLNLLPPEPLTGEPIRLWFDTSGGFVLWCVAAEEPDRGSGRIELVWQSGTEALPPELEPYREDWVQ